MLKYSIVNDTVNISPNIDPLYGFNTWSSDSVTLMPIATNMTDSFYAYYNDTVTLYIYKKPTITYDVNPAGTTTSININGNIVSIFPYSETVFVDDLNTIGDLANKHNCWFHVDAAYGGFFHLLEEHKDTFKGIEKADSLVIDPHKSLFIPYWINQLILLT